jgi:hypothetical protein
VIYTCNGINDSAAGTTDLYAAELRYLGYQVQPLRYSTVKWHQTRSLGLQYGIASDLLDQIEPGSDIVAHSFGCLLVTRMMELAGSYPFRNVLFLAPALDTDWIFPREGFRRMDVYFNRHDFAVRIAAKFPFEHPWGGMGAYGYSGPVRNDIHNHAIHEWAGIRGSHSVYFNPYQMARILCHWTSVTNK